MGTKGGKIDRNGRRGVRLAHGIFRAVRKIMYRVTSTCAPGEMRVGVQRAGPVSVTGHMDVRQSACSMVNTGSGEFHLRAAKAAARRKSQESSHGPNPQNHHTPKPKPQPYPQPPNTICLLSGPRLGREFLESNTILCPKCDPRLQRDKMSAQAGPTLSGLL